MLLLKTEGRPKGPIRERISGAGCWTPSYLRGRIRVTKSWWTGLGSVGDILCRRNPLSMLFFIIVILLSPSSVNDSVLTIRHQWGREFSLIRRQTAESFCSNIDGPRDDHTKWSESETERKIPYDITCKGTTSALLTMPKPLTGKAGKILKSWGYQITWPSSWEICMQVKKQQLELDMEQQTGSK